MRPQSCFNAARSPLADPDAKVSVVAGRIIVSSASRPFQIDAGELVRSFNGIEVPLADEGAR